MITVIGKSSFIAKSVESAALKDGWQFLPHKEALLNPSWVKKTKCVINFSFDPYLRSRAYDPARDTDSKLARLIAETDIHYIMISSRMVYGKPGALKEADETKPVNPYGASKLKIEKTLSEMLKEKLTILRLSNIFGIEPGRSSFLGMAQTSLRRDKRIVFDMSPFVRRDFLSAWHFAPALIKIASEPKAGIFNLGAGFGIETGKIAEWLIEGYGEGQLHVNRFSREDEFWLDMSHTKKTYDLPAFTAEQLREDCLQCGRTLKTWKEAA